MSSTNAWKAFEAYDKYFQKYSSFPLIFHVSGNHSKITQKRGIRCLKYFYLTWTITLIGFSYSFILLLARLSEWEMAANIPLWVILFQVLVGVMAAFAFAIQTGAALSDGNLAVTWTGGIEFEAELRRCKFI